MAMRGRPGGHAMGVAGSMTGGGGAHHMEEQLQQLQEELREKTLALVSVQRNYESISRLIQMKQQELEQAQTAVAVEQAAVVSMGVKLEEWKGRCASLETQLDGFKPLPGQLAELQAGQEALRREAAQANGKLVALQETVKGLRKQLEDEQHRSRSQKQQLDAWLKSDAGREDEVGGLRRQLEESQGDCRALASEVRSLKEAVGRSQAAHQAEAQRAAGLSAQVTSQLDTIRGLQDELRTQSQLTAELRSAVRAGEVSLAAAHSGQAVLEAQLRGAQRGAELTRQYQDELAAKMAAVEGQLAEAKKSLEAKDAEAARLRSLLSDAEEQYQTSLGKQMAADDVSNGLQLQLAQTRGLLAEARRNATHVEAEAARTAAEAAAAVRAAESRAADLSRRLSALQYRATEHGNVLSGRVGASAEKLVQMAQRANRGLDAQVETVDKAIAVTQMKLQTWESELVDMEAALLGMGNAVEALSTIAIKRQAERDRDLTAVMGDAAALRSRVSELEAALQGETQARQLLAQSKAALEVEHRAALKAAQAAADDRVETERQRLGARLAAVEAEVGRLTKTHTREAEAAARVWQMEREQLVRRAQEAEAEVVRLQEVKQEVQQKEEVSTEALAVLHTRLTADLKAAEDRYTQQLKENVDNLNVCRTHIRVCWSTSSKLFTDMALVAKHLTRMGVQVPDGAGELPPQLRGVAEDGSGALTEQLVGALRLHFSFVAEGVQAMVRKLQLVQQQAAEMEAKAASVDPAAWNAVASELRTTVAKLVHVEESLAPPCTCLMCLDVFKQPVTLIPCGHTFCRKCLAEANGLCTECGSATPAATTILNAPLDAICAKYELKRSALASIQRVLGATQLQHQEAAGRAAAVVAAGAAGTGAAAARVISSAASGSGKGLGGSYTLQRP